MPERGWAGVESVPKRTYEFIVVDRPDELGEILKSTLSVRVGARSVEPATGESLNALLGLSGSPIQLPRSDAFLLLTKGERGYATRDIDEANNVLRNAAATAFGVNRALSATALGKPVTVVGYEPDLMPEANVPGIDRVASLGDSYLLSSRALLPASLRQPWEAAGAPHELEVSYALGEGAETVSLTTALQVEGFADTPSAIVSSELLAMIARGRQVPLAFDATNRNLVEQSAGYRGFRVIGETIESIPQLVERFAQAGISVRARSDEILKLQRLERSLTLLVWVVAMVALLGGYSILTSSFFSNVQRKQVDYATLRLRRHVEASDLPHSARPGRHRRLPRLCSLGPLLLRDRGLLHRLARRVARGDQHRPRAGASRRLTEGAGGRVVRNWQQSVFRRVAAFLLAAVLQACVAGGAAGATCEEVVLTAERLRTWYNPHPSADDFELPIRLGISLVFTPISLGPQGLYGDEKTTYKMGASESRLFETRLEVRVGSSISSGGESLLLMGKYDLSKAQYAAVMGSGSLADGVRILTERSRDPQVKEVFAEFLDPASPCHDKVTQGIFNVLSEPVTFLSYRDYVEFLDASNLMCISWNRCHTKLAALGPNPDLPGFIRLPLEHEWEFVARGGREFVKGTLTEGQLQADLPSIEPGATILDYAHIEFDPPRLLPIGSRKPLFGIYDMLGNAEELMQNPFTAENGYGAVGAYVARGGHFRLKRDELRVSKRVEHPAFRRDDTTREFVIGYFPNTGIRLTVGYPVFGAAERTGSTQLEDDFKRGYAPVAEAGDIAGNTIADAKDVGVVPTEPLPLNDELTPGDVDVYKMTLNTYATIELAEAAEGLRIELIDELQKVLVHKETRAGSPQGPIASAPLLPGIYFLRVEAVGAVARELKYTLRLAAKPVDDTGIERPATDALAKAARIGASSAFSQSGFVGGVDRVDTYPIEDASDEGGLEITLGSLAAPLSIDVLDDRQTVIRRALADGQAKDLTLMVNSERGLRGFVQVSRPPPPHPKPHPLPTPTISPNIPTYSYAEKHPHRAGRPDRRCRSAHPRRKRPGDKLPARTRRNELRGFRQGSPGRPLFRGGPAEEPGRSHPLLAAVPD